jgi:drug/metabolite transporter (DMT)-like permease
MTVGTLGLTLTLLGALGWTLFDLVRKRLAQEALPAPLTVWLPLGQTPLLVAWAASAGSLGLPRACLLPMAASIALNVVALVAFMRAVRRSPLSLTIPLLSLTPVGTTLLGWAFRHQVPTGFQAAGIALVLAGAVALGLRSGTWPGLRAYRREPGVRDMLLAALAWSLTAVLDQVALERGAGYGYAPALSAGVGLSLGALMLLRGQGPVLRTTARTLLARPLLLAAALFLGAAALAVQLESMRFAPVGFIETVKRGTGMAGAVLFGRLLFREPIGLPKVVAVLLLTLGVGLVVLHS